MSRSDTSGTPSCKNTEAKRANSFPSTPSQEFHQRNLETKSLIANARLVQTLQLHNSQHRGGVAVGADDTYILGPPSVAFVDTVKEHED